MRTMPADSDTLYRINDVLTALMHELGVRFVHEDEEDEALDDATYAVVEAFGLGRPRTPAEILHDYHVPEEA